MNKQMTGLNKPKLLTWAPRPSQFFPQIFTDYVPAKQDKTLVPHYLLYLSVSEHFLQHLPHFVRNMTLVCPALLGQC